MGGEILVKTPSVPPASPAVIPPHAGSSATFGLPAFQRAGQLIFEIFARGLCRVWCPIRIAGSQNLPRTPYLICANHASHIDTVALLIATGQPFSRFATLAAHDYFFATPLRRIGFAFLLNLIPLDRSASPSSTMRAVAACRDFLDQGAPGGLILFPEGGRSVTGTVGPFRRGAALFPMRLGLPVVPVSISGTRRLMPKGRLLPRRGSISIRIGEPLWETADDSVMAGAWRQVVAMQESFQ
jgi:1-acyl-sn-glycerol-3-phosphate acyltransferase